MGLTARSGGTHLEKASARIPRPYGLSYCGCTHHGTAR
jgi:hypothetical protein